MTSAGLAAACLLPLATGPANAMTLLILGLVLFLGIHSTRVFAEGWRTRK